VPSGAGDALADGVRLRAAAVAGGVVVFDASSSPPPHAVAPIVKAAVAQSSRRPDRIMGTPSQMNAVQLIVTINQIGAKVKGRRLLRI
jgi:hypothetical protein